MWKINLWLSADRYTILVHKAQISLNRLSPKLPCGESRGHKSWKSQTQTVTNHEIMKFWWKSLTQIMKVAEQTISTCRDVCDKSVTNPFVSLYWNLVRYNTRGKSATKSGDFVADTNHESLQRKSWKSATWSVSRTFMICVRDFPHGEVSVKVAKSA